MMPISIHAPHTGRDLADKTVCATLNRISIHAPHTGRDVRVALVVVGAQGISIHAPHTGRDDIEGLWNSLTPKFQSTRPIRGATQ